MSISSVKELFADYLIAMQNAVAPLLSIENLSKYYSGPRILRSRRLIRAVDGISIELRAGEVFGLV